MERKYIMKKKRIDSIAVAIVEPRMALMRPSDPLAHIEECARICYDSKGNGMVDIPFLSMLLRNGHLSVFEHAAYVPSGPAEERLMRLESSDQEEGRAIASLIRARSTQGFQTVSDLWILNQVGHDVLSAEDFLAQIAAGKWEPYKAYKSVRIVCTRGISAEFERHRTMSPTERSTRYCDGAKGPIGFVLPRPAPWAVDQNTRIYQGWYHACCNAANRYGKLRHMGVSPQYARDLLGLGLATTLTLSGSDVWWKTFIRKRYMPKAHPQAIYLVKQLCDECPELTDFCKREDIALAEAKL